MLEFDIIVAVDKNYGIGKDGQMPWHLSVDLKHFRTLTTTATPGKTNAVIMGRKTWDSLPKRFRPLPGRINLVLSRNKNFVLPSSVLLAGSLENSLVVLADKHPNDLGNIFVIGGAQVYESALSSRSCRNIYLTELHQDFHCDTFFPNERKGFSQAFQSPLQTEGNMTFRFTQWTRSIT